MRKWDYLPLERLVKITSSKRIFKKEYVTSGVPFYRTKEIKELANKQKVSTELYITKTYFEEIRQKFGTPVKGDILITAIGTIGEIYVIDKNVDFYFKDGNVLWLRDFKDIDPIFLKYSLKSFVEELNNLSSGSAYKALPIEKLKKHNIPLPPIEEQRRIAAILDKADAVRRKRQEAIALTEELLRSAFLEMFGEQHNYPVMSIGQLCKVKGGKRLPKGEQLVSHNTGYPYIIAGNLKKGTVIGNLMYLTEKTYQSISRYTVLAGDVYITIVGAYTEVLNAEI